MSSRMTGVTVASHEEVVVIIDDGRDGWGGQIISISSTQHNFPMPLNMKVNFLLGQLSDGQPTAVDVAVIPPKRTIDPAAEELQISEHLKCDSVFLSIAEKAERALYGTRTMSTPEGKQGGGGPKHQFTQLVIKTGAEEAGYSVRLEEKINPTGSSRQSVDAAIFGRGLRIACEVPVTSKYNEYGNIRKCLDAGFDYVISVSVERKVLEIVERSISKKLNPEELEKVRFLTPEELFIFLGEIPSHQPMDSLIRGYKVRTTFVEVSPAEAEARRAHVVGILARQLQHQGVETAS